MYIGIVIFRITSIWISFLALVNPLPKTNDEHIPAGTIFYSPHFQDTDQVCSFLFRHWITIQDGIGARRSNGVPLALVVSTQVLFMEEEKIHFLCKDQRTVAALRNAVQFNDEEEFSGPYYLQCMKEIESARRRPRPIGSDPIVWRSPGVCLPRIPTKRSMKKKMVSAGSTECIDSSVESSEHASLVAYMLDDNSGASGDVPADKYAEWMNIIQLGTTRHAFGEHRNRVSMDLDQTRPSVYRVCAKQQPGHGSATLYVDYI